MAFNFKASAQKATVLSHLMEGREKLETQDICNTPLTIKYVDWVQQNDNTTYPCIVFAEKENGYYCGGIVLKKIVAEWIADFNGDMDKLNGELSASGGVIVKLSMGKTKTNNNLVRVEIL